MMLAYLRRGLRYILRGPEIIRERSTINVNITYSLPNNSLKGKKILITGGNKGIGYAIAKKAVNEGADIVITGRDIVSLKKVSDELKCKFLQFDVLDFNQHESVIAKSNDLMDGLDCLINNAGISLHEEDICHVSIEQFDAQISTNLKASYFLSQKFINFVEYKKRYNCNILFVSSERGTYVDDLPYGITKNAINCLVKGLACRFIRRGIRVNAVAPGVTATELTGYEENGDLYLEPSISKRVYLPAEIAEIAIFLLSDNSKCLNGQILTCDEGRSINTYW